MAEEPTGAAEPVSSAGDAEIGELEAPAPQAAPRRLRLLLAVAAVV
ncbi:MAG TPA: signal peptidase II, partial [Mycobacterium sp.]